MNENEYGYPCEYKNRKLQQMWVYIHNGCTDAMLPEVQGGCRRAEPSMV